MTFVAAGSTSYILFAAANWTEVVVPLVVFIVWIINQAIAASKPKPGAAKPPQAPVPPGGQQQAARQGQGGLVDEVERFLQEARKAMRPEQKSKPVPPRPASAKQGSRGTQRPPKSAQQRKPQPQARQSLADRSTLKPQAADRELGDRDLGGSVSQHVQQHLDTSRFDERAGKLSQLRQEVDRDIAGQVARTFDHQVGTLGAESGTALDKSGAAMTTSDDPTGVNSVVQIVAMMSDPQSMRNAIILQEILTPPTQRW